MDADDRPRLGPGDDGGIGVGARAQVHHVGGDDRRADPRQQRIMHPATRAVAVLDPAPVPELGHHAQRHPCVAEHPVDPVRQARTAPGVPLASLQRDVARQRQVRDRTSVGVALFVLVAADERIRGHVAGVDLDRGLARAFARARGRAVTAQALRDNRQRRDGRGQHQPRRQHGCRDVHVVPSVPHIAARLSCPMTRHRGPRPELVTVPCRRQSAKARPALEAKGRGARGHPCVSGCGARAPQCGR